MCIVDRNTGKVVKMKYMSADTFFFFHHANTYEDKGNWQNELSLSTTLHTSECMIVHGCTLVQPEITH